MAVAPRICKKCFAVEEHFDEKNDEPKRCRKCINGILTKYLHKVKETLPLDKEVANKTDEIARKFGFRSWEDVAHPDDLKPTKKKFI